MTLFALLLIHFLLLCCKLLDTVLTFLNAHMDKTHYDFIILRNPSASNHY